MRSFVCSPATDMHGAVRLESSFMKIRVNSMLQKYVAKFKGLNPRKQGLTASLQNYVCGSDANLPNRYVLSAVFWW